MLALRQIDMLGTPADWLALQNDLETDRCCSCQAFLHIENPFLFNYYIRNFIKTRYQKCLSKSLSSLPWKTLMKETGTLQVPLHWSMKLLKETEYAKYLA